MNDLVVLALVAIGLYLLECVIWARRGAVVVTAPWYFGRLRMSPPSASMGNGQGGLTLLNPLPPFGRVYVVEPWPFSPGRDGVVAAVTFAWGNAARQAGSGRFVAWADVKRVRVDEKAVFLNDEKAPFARCSSARHAKNAAAVLRSLALASSTSDRERLLEEKIASSLAVPHVTARARSHQWMGLPLLLSTLLCFVIFFGFVPLIVAREGLQRWPHLLASVYSSVVMCALSTWLVHRALMKEARGDRWMATLLSLPAPTLAIRGNDKVGRYLLADSHPIGAAIALLSGARRTEAVLALLRDLRFPRQPALPVADAAAAAAEQEFRQHLERQATEAARQAGVDVEAAFLPPPQPKGFSTYCLRCHTVYRDGSTCADCGVPAVTFTPGALAEPARDALRA